MAVRRSRTIPGTIKEVRLQDHSKQGPPQHVLSTASAGGKVRQITIFETKTPKQRTRPQTRNPSTPGGSLDHPLISCTHKGLILDPGILGLVDGIWEVMFLQTLIGARDPAAP